MELKGNLTLKNQKVPGKKGNVIFLTITENQYWFRYSETTMKYFLV